MVRSARVLNGFNKAGFHSGRLHAKNILAGRVDVSLGSGDGTTTVTFAKPMRNANYLVLLSLQESTTNEDMTLCVSAKTPQDFVINVTSTNHTGPITIGFLVLDSRTSGPVSHTPGRFGFHPGYAHFRNLQWGMVRVALNAAVTIKLPRPMKNKPLVFASIDDETVATAGFVYVATGGTQTNAKFILDNTGVTGPSGTVDITWVAFDPGFNFGTIDADGHTGSALAGEMNRQSKFGIHSGDFRAKNFVGGIHKMTTSSNDASEAITLGQRLRNIPIVFTMLQSPVNDTTAITYAGTITDSSFTMGVEKSATANGDVFLAYLAIDAEHLPTGAPESELVA